MLVLSATRPIRPPSASTSRTTIPFAGPPTLGLHGIKPIVSKFIVIIKVLTPFLLAACAASIPACPPPITITSYSFKNSVIVPPYILT